MKDDEFNFQNKYTNSVNFGHRWKVVDKKSLHYTYENSHDYKER